MNLFKKVLILTRMSALEITLTVILSIVGVYLLLVLVDIIFVLVFKKIFKKHDKTITVLLTTKYDIIKRIIEQLNSLNISVEFKYIKMLQDINIKSFSNKTSKETVEYKNNLNLIKENIFSLIRNNDIASKHKELGKMKNDLQELELHYRSLVIMYNSDVLGYNYWIKFLPTRYLWLKAKDKDFIQ